MASFSNASSRVKISYEEEVGGLMLLAVRWLAVVLNRPDTSLGHPQKRWFFMHDADDVFKKELPWRLYFSRQKPAKS